MSVIALFDALHRHDSGGAPNLGHPLPPRVKQLAADMVRAFNDDYGRLKFYDDEFGPTLADDEDDNKSLQVLRSIRLLFTDWVEEAEKAYERVRALTAAGHIVPDADTLRDNIGRARARLTVTPEQTVRAKQQLRAGEGVHTTVEALRNELRARRGA